MFEKQYECFNVTIEDKIAHIQLSRGDKLNTMTRQFWNELPQLVRQIDREALARVIVISSTGKHFCAGMDLSVFAGEGDSGSQGDQWTRAERFRSNIDKIQGSLSSLEQARQPVLVACHGGVIGGAVDLVCAGDIRWATKDTFCCIEETNIAMVADVGTFPRIQRYASEGWVKQMAYTGERIGAEKLKEIGLVNDVFDTHEEMLEHVMGVARQIAKKDPLVVTGCKNVINYGRDHSTADSLQYVGLWNAGMMPGDHMVEAMTARAEKRDPVFPDLLKLRDTAL